MKKTALFLFCLNLTIQGMAQDNVKTAKADTTVIPSLSEIIETESKLSSKKANEDHYRKVWNKTKFFNISYNNTKLSSEEFPTADGVYSNEFKNNFGVGIHTGNTYNFHKNPIGSVLFIGLDYLPLDLNFNMYDAVETPASFQPSTETPRPLPWHNKKMTLDYSMSLGPALTLYPFTPIGNTDTDKIRLHLYFRVGYSVGAAMISDVEEIDRYNRKKDETSNEFAWGNGLYTSFGFNLTWNFIGFGFESRKCNKFTFRPIGDSYKTGDFDTEWSVNRLYIQFRY